MGRDKTLIISNKFKCTFFHHLQVRLNKIQCPMCSHHPMTTTLRMELDVAFSWFLQNCQTEILPSFYLLRPKYQCWCLFHHELLRPVQRLPLNTSAWESSQHPPTMHLLVPPILPTKQWIPCFRSRTSLVYSSSIIFISSNSISCISSSFCNNNSSTIRGLIVHRRQSHS